MSEFSEDFSFSVLSAQHIKWNKKSVRTEGRPYSALVLRLYSGVKLKCDNRIIRSNPMDITYMPSDMSYSADYDADGEMIYIHFTERTPFFPNVSNFTPTHFDDIYTLFKKIASICTAKRENYKLESASVLMQIIVYLTRLKSDSQTISGFEKAVRIIKDEYTNPTLTIGDVSRRADLSDSYLRKLFNDRFGMSPVRYLNELRIDHAQKMLYSNYCTVENAAIKSGFSDYRYFSRVSKKLRGCSPSMLRNI
ncbi:MAG: helix-turn-helix transcriptional regulator [Clostridia bacterium]|nr:helix-turn-helix transcriptional regulator [Clostridia bacterium]